MTELKEANYYKAKKKLRSIKTLIKHFIVFIMINILIIALNVLTYTGNLWFWWISLPWMILLLVHYFSVYDIDELFFNKDWEEKKIEKILRK